MVSCARRELLAMMKNAMSRIRFMNNVGLIRMCKLINDRTRGYFSRSHRRDGLNWLNNYYSFFYPAAFKKIFFVIRFVKVADGDAVLYGCMCKFIVPQINADV